MLALFLGAGFSKWAVDLPVAMQLFDFNIEPWGPHENGKLIIVKSLKQKWDMTHPKGLAEQFIADSMNFPKKHKEAVLWYIVRRLSDPFVWSEFHAQKWRRHVLMIDENRRFKIGGIIKVRNFLNRFCSPCLAGIITTNYDMLVEYALTTKGFNYGIPNQRLIGRGPYPVSTWKNPVMLTGKIPLAKIHGSISWDEKGCYTDGRRGLTGQALIVAPTPKKRPLGYLQSVWKLANNILQRSTRLIVFGFAFNPYDDTVLNLLQAAGRNLKSILLIDIEPQPEKARYLWPNATLAFCHPPPDGDVEIQAWQQKL